MTDAFAVHNARSGYYVRFIFDSLQDVHKMPDVAKEALTRILGSVQTREEAFALKLSNRIETGGIIGDGYSVSWQPKYRSGEVSSL